MEFVLVIPLMMILLIGIVEVAVVARTSLELVAAAREGARVAATTPDTDRNGTSPEPRPGRRRRRLSSPALDRTRGWPRPTSPTANNRPKASRPTATKDTLCALSWCIMMHRLTHIDANRVS